MKRPLGFLALALLICGVTTQTFVRGQDRTQDRPPDRVERKDRKGGSTSVAGRIVEETPAGVRVKVQGIAKEEVIPSDEIVRVTYGDLPQKAGIEIGKLATAETNRDYPALLKGYEAVRDLPEMKAASAPTRRYIDYRVASLRGLTAEGDDQLKAAVQSLADFVAAHPGGWEYPHAARQLGRLQADTGDYAGATTTFEALAKANVPAEFKHEATAALIDVAFQSEDYKLGAQRVDAVLKDPEAPSSLRDRVAIYKLGLEGADADLAVTVKKLEEAISKAADPGLKALGYNVLGDVYRAKGQRRDAMWSYLWVDVYFNQDRSEHLKALTRLVKLSEEEKDGEKVKLYRDKLARAR